MPGHPCGHLHSSPLRHFFKNVLYLLVQVTTPSENTCYGYSWSSKLQVSIVKVINEVAEANKQSFVNTAIHKYIYRHYCIRSQELIKIVEFFLTCFSLHAEKDEKNIVGVNSVKNVCWAGAVCFFSRAAAERHCDTTVQPAGFLPADAARWNHRWHQG